MQSGIIDQNVNSAELPDHLLEHSCNVLLERDVGIMGVRVSTGLAYVVHHGVSGDFVLNVVHYHIRAGPTHSESDTAPDARIRAGHKCFLTRQQFRRDDG